MTTANAIKKLSKYGEVKNNGNHYCAVIGEKEVSFYRNGPEMTDSAICFRVRRLNDHDDSNADYTAGSFRDNLTQAIRSALKTV